MDKYLAWLTQKTEELKSYEGKFAFTTHIGNIHSNKAYHYRKHCMCGCHTRKQHFIAMMCDSKSHTIILGCVISVKLNIGKKIAGLEILTLNHEKI